MRWTRQQLDDLRSCVEKHIGTDKEQDAFEKASRLVGKSISSCKMKYSRTDWNAPESESDKQPWTIPDNRLLYQLRHDRLLNGKSRSYVNIGRVMGRSPIACERQYQTMDKDAFMSDNSTVVLTHSEEGEGREHKSKPNAADKDQQQRIERFADWLTSIAKLDLDRLAQIDSKTFAEKVKKAHDSGMSRLCIEDLPVSFEELKGIVRSRLESFGYAYPKELVLGAGTYVIVGDSHGKHTRNGMFDLLETINRTIKPNKVIHVGHIFDDDDEISFRWNAFPNLVVVGMSSELKSIKEQSRKYDVVRGWVRLGNLSVGNQYDTTDFTKKAIGRIDSEIIPDRSILNCHRHELHSRCKYNGHRVVASPGCICERHPIRTVKQLIFKDGMPSIRVTHPMGYHKYNKQEGDNARWEQGIIIVEVAKDGSYGMTHCRVQVTSKGYTTSYAGLVLHEKGTSHPDKKIFFNGDFHSPMYDGNALDIQEQFCRDYSPDVHVNIGDILDNRAVNHHMGGSTGPAFYVKSGGEVVFGKVLSEMATARYLLARMRNWAKESKLIIGNHERFLMDFVLKHPQFKELMDVEFLLGTAELGIDVTFLKGTFDMGGVRFIHGDVKVWGGDGGSKIEKIAANYGENTVMGNIHYSAIRNGCYSVAMSGKLNQDYNEADASQWLQGFGYCDVFEDKCFVSLSTIDDGKCIVRGKTYSPRPEVSGAGWETPPFKATLVFDFQGTDTGSTRNPLDAPGTPRKTIPAKKTRSKG